MTRTNYLLLLAAVTVSCTANNPAKSNDAAVAPSSNLEDKTTQVAKGDPEMAAAMAKARSTLPEFWKHARKPGPKEDEFAVKVPIKDGDVTEYFWLGDLEQDGSDLYGYVADNPELVHNVKLRDRLKIVDEDIVDWMYYRNDKIVGNYTLRALFKNMSPEDVKEAKAKLDDP